MQRRIRLVLFRIFYSTSFTVVFLLVITHVLLTPTDAIYQAYKGGRIFDIFIVAGVYVLTALIAALLYASRLYTNRSVLQGIPKSYVPIEKGDLPGRWVRKMIADGLARSAVVAYQARPKIKKVQDVQASADAHMLGPYNSDQDRLLKDRELAWGQIAHPGWSSPSSPDLPDLYFDTVIAELPDLTEAKAVSLIPVDPFSMPNSDGIAMPDERAVEVLQRPAEMGFREYIAQLQGLGMIRDRDLGNEFLAAYERARFAAVPLSEPEFRSLMSIFAEILRGMNRPDAGLIGQIHADAYLGEWRSSDKGAGEGTAHASDYLEEQDNGSNFSKTAGSVRRGVTHEDRQQSQSTGASAPSMPASDDEDQMRQCPPSKALAVEPLSPNRTTPQVSLSSRKLRQTRSNISVTSRISAKSRGSVIHLVEARNQQGLPYANRIPSADIPSP